MLRYIFIIKNKVQFFIADYSNGLKQDGHFSKLLAHLRQIKRLHARCMRQALPKQAIQEGIIFPFHRTSY